MRMMSLLLFFIVSVFATAGVFDEQPHNTVTETLQSRNVDEHAAKRNQSLCAEPNSSADVTDTEACICTDCATFGAGGSGIPKKISASAKGNSAEEIARKNRDLAF